MPVSPNIGDFQVQTFTSFDALRAVAPVLASDGPNGEIFYSWAWFENLARHGIDNSRGVVLPLVRRRDGSGAFCLPLLVREGGRAALFGATLEGLSNFYSSLYGPIGNAAHVNEPALRALLNHLRLEPLPNAVIDLNALDDGSTFFHDLRAALRAQGWTTDTYFCFGNWYLPVEGRSFDAYYTAVVPSRLRNTIKRAERKLDGAGAWTLRIHQEPGADTDKAISDFVSVYRQSWKVSEPFPEFVPTLCRAAARQSWLRLGVVHLGDVPIAAQLWLVRGRTALIYKLAYSEQYKKLSAGSVLTARLFRHAIDVDGCNEIDYLTGDDEYKADWMTHRRERRGIVAFRLRSPQGMASAARHYIGRWMRSKMRSPNPSPTLTATVDD